MLAKHGASFSFIQKSISDRMATSDQLPDQFLYIFLDESGNLDFSTNGSRSMATFAPSIALQLRLTSRGLLLLGHLSKMERR
jgi:hypothetical protein